MVGRQSQHPAPATIAKLAVARPLTSKHAEVASWHFTGFGVVVSNAGPLGVRVCMYGQWGPYLRHQWVLQLALCKRADLLCVGTYCIMTCVVVFVVL